MFITEGDMAQSQIMYKRKDARLKKSWLEAYSGFLRSSHEHRVLKMMPLALLGVVPLSIADDVLLPFVGFIDDVPTSVLTLIVLGLTLARVNKYR